MTAGVVTRVRPAEKSPVYMAYIFFLSLLPPIFIPIGPVLLMPHRFVLLLFFIPMALRLLSGRAGPINAVDWFMLASTLWVCLALVANHGIAQTIEGVGIHIIEFFGSYLLGRVAVRNASDMARVVKFLFVMLMLLLPFAALESLLRTPFLLNLIPGSIPPIDYPFRWGMRRAQTMFTHPIHYGIFASIGMGLYWYILRPYATRIFTVPMVVLSTMFSLSSGPLIGLACQFGLIAWDYVMRGLRQRWLVLGVLVIAGYITLDIIANSSPFEVLITYASFNTGSAYNRILIWEYGLQNVWTNPFFGLGYRDWVRPEFMVSSADNFWLVLAMLYGIPSFLFFAIACLLIMWKSARAKLTAAFDKSCRMGFLISMGGIIIGGGTVHYWTSMMALVLFLFASGIWTFTGGAVNEGDPDEPDAESDPTPRRPVYTRFPNATPTPRGLTKAAEPQPVLRRASLKANGRTGKPPLPDSTSAV